MRATDILRIKRLADSAPYNDSNKQAFRRLALKFLHEVEQLLGHSNTDVRFNAAGIAVCGDAILHSDQIYILIGGLSDLGILVRTVKHNRDYTGGRNTYFSFERLAQTGAAGLAQYVQQLIARESAVLA